MSNTAPVSPPVVYVPQLLLDGSPVNEVTLSYIFECLGALSVLLSNTGLLTRVNIPRLKILKIHPSKDNEYLTGCKFIRDLLPTIMPSDYLRKHYEELCRARHRLEEEATSLSDDGDAHQF